ncbi:MAG TPA: hypothetical protein VN670_00225, partial [Acidobacteriaceae bacterium]|nr:hypothetical protein [Acidobacteriaceae bacterium]
MPTIRVTGCLMLLALLVLAGCRQEASNPQKTSSPQPAASFPPPAIVPVSAPPAIASSTVPRPSGPIQFTDVTAQAGIRFKHNNGAFGKKYLP